MSLPPDVAAYDGNRDDAVALLAGVPLTEDEAGYVEAARAANTLAGTARTGPSSPPGAPPQAQHR